MIAPLLLPDPAASPSSAPPLPCPTTGGPAECAPRGAPPNPGQALISAADILKARILIVDDKEANVSLLQQILQGAGYVAVSSTMNPQEVCALHLRHRYNLILLDLQMPGMDGFQVMEGLKAIEADGYLPVLVITAQPGHKLRALHAGARDFISKPFELPEVVLRVRNMLEVRLLHLATKKLCGQIAAEQQASQELLRVIRSGPFAMCIATLDGARVIDVNGQCCSFSGYAREEIVGRSILDLQLWVRPEDRARVMRQLPRDGTIQNYEAQLRRRSGEVRDIIASLRLIELVGEREPVCITMFIDITERKAAERALREDEQWLKAIFDQAAVGVVQFDVTTGNFVRANQRFCDMLGYPREEMARRTQAEITYPHDRGVDEENLARLRAGTIREFAREKRFVRKDGSLVWASIAVSAIGAPGAPPTAFVGVVQDISERKRLDEHFLQAQKMEALGQFSGGVAHDFNNILMAISGYTELSQLSLRENPEVHDNLTLVLQAARRASDLVRQILTFSRQQPQVRQSILLQPVVEETLKLLRATIPSTIAFDRAVAPDAPTVLADANQVHQVLMNLGTNAWYAMKDRPGRLQVKLESFSVDAAYAAAQPPLRPGIYARVSVADTGCGMDPATLRRIFEPFFTTKPPGEGTGLGLAVVHGIMESHDGAVTVHSQPGEGTEFRLYFPAHASAAAGTAAPAGAVPRGHGERVLVVDDEELLAQLVQKALTLLGYQAEAVTQPAAALALVLADPARFALVLTDQTMPGMTGLGLAAELRKIRPDLPVILMTGHGAALTPERIQAAGIRQLLPKPIGIPSLGAAVHAVLSAPSLR